METTKEQLTRSDLVKALRDAWDQAAIAACSSTWESERARVHNLHKMLSNVIAKIEKE